PRGAAPGKDAARGDRGGLRAGLVRDPRLERHHLLFGAHPVPVRQRPGARLRGDPLPRHPDQPGHRGVRHARGLRLPHLAAAPRHGERMKGDSSPMATGRPARGAETPAPVQHRFFELIPPGTRIDFVGLRFKMLLLSWTTIAVGLAWAYVGGINWGIDFVGGTMVHVKFAAPTPIGDVRAALLKPELGEALVQDVGRAGNEFQIRVRGAEKGGSSSVSDAIKADLREKFGEGTYDMLRVETVGPKVGKDLGRSATLAVLAATLVMGVYIALRFELRFGIGAAIALLHDVLMTFGALAIARMEFDLTMVAALTRAGGGRRRGRGGARTVVGRWVWRGDGAVIPRVFADTVADLGVAHAPLVARCLWNREVRDRDAAASFLRPTLAHGLRSPLLLKDMARAATRLADALAAGEPIAVYGDYDVDGITGAAE